MFKHYFEQVQNVEIWPIISLIIFFVFFTITLVRIFFLDKGYLEKMSGLPLEDEGNEYELNLKN